MALLVLFARSYLAPFRTGTGQLVLVGVFALYGCGIWLMAKLARMEPPVRLLRAEGLP